VIEVDGKNKSGFTSMRTGMFKSYIVKLLTGTLPTADILHKKWDIYQSDLCPRCREAPESNEHIWACRRASNNIATITSNFRNKRKLPEALTPDIKKAIKGIVTTDLTESLKQFWKKRCAEEDSDDEDTHELLDERIDMKNVHGDILRLIRKGHQEV